MSAPPPPPSTAPAPPKRRWGLLLGPLALSLTLGLAPFAPEPHIVGKLRWLMGGAVGMGGDDWFDLLLHGTPWLWLLFTLVRLLLRRPEGG